MQSRYEDDDDAASHLVRCPLRRFAGHVGRATETTTAAIDSLQAIIAAGAYERAVDESEALLSRWETTYGAESLEVAKALDKLAQALTAAGRGTEPRTTEVARRAVAIKSRLLGSEHLETAASLFRLAEVHRSCNRLAEAIETLDRVLVIRLRELGAEHELVADVHGGLGIAMATAGRLEDARVHFELTVQILEAVGGPDDPELAGAYTNLSTFYYILGDLPAAVVANQKAIANVERTRGADHPAAGSARYALGNVYLARGDIRAAADQYQRAQQVFAANGMTDHPDMAMIDNGIGLVAKSLGNYADAVRRFERSLEISEKTLGLDHPALTYYLNNLGIAAQQNGDDVRARAALERSVQIARENLDGDDLRTLSSEYFLAKFELRQGNLDAAEPQLAHCLDRFAAVLGEDHHRVAEAAGDLARVKELRNDLDAAEQLFDRALATGGAATNPAGLASLQVNRARVRLRTGRYQASCEEALQAEGVAADQYRLVVQTLSEGVSRRFATTRINGLSVALSALLAHESPAGLTEQAWQQVIRSRGMLLDELTARRRLVASSRDQETRLLAEQVFAARSRLADMYIRGADDRSAERYAVELASARDDKRAAEAALATRSAAFRSAGDDRSLGLTDVRDSLPAGSALVAMQSFRRITEQGEEPWYCAFVLVDDSVTVVDLGAATVIDSLISQWRTGLLQAWAPGGELAAASIAANRELGARLRELVWSPYAARLTAVETVFVVPDGDLHLLPLAALPATAGGYLLEHGPTFHYLNREKSLVRPSTDAGHGLLVFGDPAFDAPVNDGSGAPSLVATLMAGDYPDLQGVLRGAPPDCDRLRSMQFGALPGTRRECEDIVSLVPDNARLLMSDDATEAAFKANLGGRRIVHLATHGYFVGSDCPAEAAGYADDPLLLSGLALAGANLRADATEGQEDGILTAEEISLLDLTGVEWVVLSACDTGLGVLQPGEGVHGLQRAFETAGAGTGIMSLWPVEDQATRQWMSGLYRARLRGGQSTPAAVRQAALGVLEQRRAAGLSEHPFWWAGFVAAGDWR